MNMKIVLFSLLCLILIGMTSYSYAQTYDEKNTESPTKIMLQLELRDSNGNLALYLEAEQILAIYNPGIDKFIANHNLTSKEFFIEDDKYDVYQWEQSNQTFDARSAYSTTRLLTVVQDEFTKPIIMRHYSIQSEPGDTLRIFWTVIRPAS